jgi:GT2 family glycosyltransferase
MLLSVIVPTRNRLASLKRLMQSLDLLRIPEENEVEVVVVDNNSNDGTFAWLQRECGKCRKFQLFALRETKTGKASALNRGIVATRGECILVLDDDVVVDSELVARHLDCYRTQPFGALQGRIVPGVDPEGQPADPERLNEYNIPLTDYGDEFQEIVGLIGTNMSVKREVLDKVGLFDPRLGPGASGFSEDTEFSARIRMAGFKIGYTPQAIAYHELDPARYGRAYKRNVEYRKGLSRSIYRNDSLALKLIPNLLINCTRYCIYSVLGRTKKSYVIEGRISKSWGQIVGTLQSRRNGEI